MANKKKLEDIIPQFLESPECKALHDYSREMIVRTIKMISEVTDNSDLGDYSKWDEEFIVSLVMSMVDEFDEGDAHSFAMIITIYDVIKAVLKYLATNKEIPVTSKKVDQLLTALETKIGLNGEFPEKKMAKPEHNDPNLPKWSQHIADDIASYSDKWVDSYIQSPDWKKRQKGVTEDFLDLIMSALTEFAYDIYRKTPKSWTKKAMTEIMQMEFIDNLELSKADYQLIVPALSDLFDFVAKKGWLKEQKAQSYKRFLIAGEPKMLKEANEEFELEKENNNIISLDEARKNKGK
ncbi:hypothetical protein COSHB9_11460 [Companilactobacillus alimentarius]|uniref:Uncharacterized protein n=1 Tax=Companilactobacillus alimentarius DSM 20249 TaxID=1423720 RepID=A0A2K9HKJ3_9LACO|nr:hypothetical protein [Companilactobacillus alimentarius]AUI72337.1 hypothetical protein LA20249_09140 [Companilactobacillus alimentarius DSM 20249]KRK76644.1 hypothetical protein FC67_GL000545 [Companilactobacillus alimentarius DSM 20249]MDT6952918.1 hypothetical protein [Companilactobacillus alimentarius]GEO45893.1 hypothetical protein LAL01_21250 [Companilactobacillus alimentarius]